MAVVSLIALFVALGLVALAVLQPWAGDSVAPRLGVAPDLGAGLGDSVAVPSTGGLALAPARPAPATGPKLLGGVPAAGGTESEARLQASIGPAQVVASALVSLPGGAPQPAAPEAVPSPQGPAPTEPAVVPVASPSPAAMLPGGAPAERGGGVPSGPVGAGSGPGAGEPEGAIEVGEGEEGAFAFSFLAQPTVYLAPGEENLLVRIAGEGGESPGFGLQLWDDGAQRGLWSSGDAAGGERFLAPLADGVWHRVAVAFEASSAGDGFYLVLLDGQPVDARAWVSLIESGGDSAAIDVGLFRDGERAEDGSEVLFGPTEFGESLESVLP